MRIRRYLRAALTGLAVSSMLIACDAEPRIVLGPLPERPLDIDYEDAGIEIPDGAVACTQSSECDDAVDCTIDVCLAAGYCQSTSSAANCSDGEFCNGLEFCHLELGCISGNVPACDDQDACTIDRCDETQKACVHGSRDFDRDGETDVHCPGGTDCDDFDETRGGRAFEICGDVVDNDCDEGVDEKGCGSAASDSCDDALDVSIGGTFTIPLVGAAAEYVLSCEPNASRDVVATFTLKQPKDVKLVARGELADGSEEVAVIALQRACGELESEIECRRSFPAELRRRALPAGEYFVVASSFGARAIDLSVSFSAPSKAFTNTSCANAIDLGEGGRFEGSFIDVGDVVTTSCGVAGQPDLFYELTLAQKSDVEIVAISDEGAALTFNVRDGCDTKAKTLRCESNAPAQGRLHELGSGTYVIVVSGPSTREVSFALDVAVLSPTPAPRGDSCSRPLELELGEKQQIKLSDKRDLVTTSCERSGPDAVLSLRVPRAMDLDVDLDAGDSFASFALQSKCSDPKSDVSCRGAAPVQTRVRDVPAGDYFVIVSSATARSVTLEVNSLPRSAPMLATDNGSCSKATLVPEAGGLFRGDTSAAFDDYQAPCGGGARSNDSVFKLVLPEIKRVVARVDASFDSVLYRITDDRDVAEACKDVDPAACDDDSGEGSQAELDENLEPGTYYYVVDGFKSGNAGTYLFDVDVTDE